LQSCGATSHNTPFNATNSERQSFAFFIHSVTRFLSDRRMKTDELKEQKRARERHPKGLPAVTFLPLFSRLEFLSGNPMLQRSMIFLLFFATQSAAEQEK
jgi:hypothetical protein